MLPSLARGLPGSHITTARPSPLHSLAAPLRCAAPCRASKTWFDRLLDPSGGSNGPAFSQSLPAPASSSAGAVGGSGGDEPAADEHGHAGLQQAVRRDIVTGEVIGSSGSGSGDGAGDIQPPTRDIRLEPVNQIAKWIGGGGGSNGGAAADWQEEESSAP